MLTVDDIPLLWLNVRFLRIFGLLEPRTKTLWFLNTMVINTFLLNAFQCPFLYSMLSDMTNFSLNLFYAAVSFNGAIRTALLVRYRCQFQDVLNNLVELYTDIVETGDCEECAILEEANLYMRKFTIINQIFSVGDVIYGCLLPLTGSVRAHPMGVSIPTVDVTASPVFEIIYILMVPQEAFIAIMYMPYISIIGAFAVFSSALLRIVRHRLGKIGEAADAKKMIDCFRFYTRITNYVKNVNGLLTYVLFSEFVVFSIIIGALVFCLNLVSTFLNMALVAMYILTALYIPFTYYWHANEMMLENVKVSEAVYNLPWYTFNINLRKMVLLFLMQTQKPLMFRVANVYPLTLETFRSLLSASYSYFTLLSGTTK